MDRALRSNLRRLGFTPAEIAGVDEELKALPSRDEPSSVALKQRRYRARKRAQGRDDNIPPWARKRL